MHYEKTSVLTHLSRRSSERRGLEAIFSSEKTGIERQVLAGAAGVIAGLILSILAILRTNDPQALGPSSNVVYSSLTFGAFGILLMICGGGTLTFAFVHNESKISNTVTSPIDRPSHVDVIEDALSEHQTQRMFGQGSRIGGVAFIQSLVLVAFYSGFVQEFESNSTMQIWVRSNIPVGQSFLNWEAVLVLSVVLSFLLLQFLPGRFFSE